MKKWNIFAAFLTLFVGLPISFYLQYKVLKLVDSTELMWFLFWVHWPILIMVKIILKVAEAAETPTNAEIRK